MIDTRREQRSVLAVQPLLVRRVSPRLAVAGDQMRRVLDERNPTSRLNNRTRSLKSPVRVEHGSAFAFLFLPLTGPLRSEFPIGAPRRRDRPLYIPWILFTASALATSRIRLGTAITPVARRRPSKLAREVTTLDSLTGGRMILGAGPDEPVAGEYGSFGDTTDTKVLAERLDEGLHALDLLWSGELVTYRGNQITIDDVVFLPVPVQLPRVPVWGGGVWPNKAPMRRAARWDGAIPVMAGWESGGPPDLSEVQELVTFLRAAAGQRTGSRAGRSTSSSAARARPARLLAMTLSVRWRPRDHVVG